MSASQWLWLVALSVVWGGSFFFTGVVVDDLPPLTIVLSRVGIAAIILIGVVYASGLALPATAAGWAPFAGMAVLNNVIPFTCMVLGQAHISSGLAAVMNATTPIWSVILLHVFTSDEKLTFNKTVGVILGALGVSTLIGPSAFDGLSNQIVGILFLCGTAISYGCAAVWGRRLRGTPPRVTAAAQLTASTAILLPLVLIFEPPTATPIPDQTTLAALVGLAVVSTALAYLIFFHILSVSGPANAMLVTLLIPISSIALGTAFLGEVLLPRHFVGAAIISFGLLAIDGRLLNCMRTRRPAKPS